jgi:hypothetical protein
MHPPACRKQLLLGHLSGPVNGAAALLQLLNALHLRATWRIDNSPVAPAAQPQAAVEQQLRSQQHPHCCCAHSSTPTAGALTAAPPLLLRSQQHPHCCCAHSSTPTAVALTAAPPLLLRSQQHPHCCCAHSSTPTALTAAPPLLLLLLLLRPLRPPQAPAHGRCLPNRPAAGELPSPSCSIFRCCCCCCCCIGGGGCCSTSLI